MAYCRPNSLNTRLDASPEGTSGLSASAISPIVLWAALGGSHHCAQDEPEPGALRERRRFPHNSAEMLTRDTGGLIIGQSESGRRAARYKLTHQDWPIGSGARTKWFLGVTFREGRFSFPMRLAQRIEAFGVLSHKRTFSLP